MAVGRNKVLKGFFIVGLVVTTLYLCLYFWAGSKVNKFHFVNYEELARTDYLWKPDFLPNDAVDINVTTGLDPSFVMLEYRYKSKPLLLNNKFIEIESEEKDKAYSTLKTYRYWSNKKFKDLMMYKNNSGVLAIDPKQKYVWYSIEH